MTGEAPQKSLADEKLALLKLELGILSSQISGTVDNLWKIRSLALTLWSAAIGIGLGNFSTSKEPSIVLIIITIFIPLWFFWIDARYNRWYRRVSLREQQIQKFINDRNYVLPSTGTQVSFDDIFTKNIFTFPVYDLSGEATFGKEPHFIWGVSLAKNLIDTIPLFVYGSQILCSTILSTIYTPGNWRWVFIPLFIFLGSITLIYPRIVRKRIFRDT